MDSRDNCHMPIVHQPDSEPSESGENHSKQQKNNGVTFGIFLYFMHYTCERGMRGSQFSYGNIENRPENIYWNIQLEPLFTRKKFHFFAFCSKNRRSIFFKPWIIEPNFFHFFTKGSFGQSLRKWIFLHFSVKKSGSVIMIENPRDLNSN